MALDSYLIFPSFSIYGLFKQLMMGIPIGNNPISNEGVISFSVFIGLGLPILFWFMNLKIRVSKKDCIINFFQYTLKNA